MPVPTSQKRPFIPAPGVVQVEMIYELMGNVCENVYHVRLGDGSVEPTLAQMSNLANVFENWESTQMRGFRTTFCSLSMIRVRQLGVQNGIVYEQAPVSPTQGLSTSPALPGNVTYALKWTTGQGGRSFRGRSYHVGMVLASISGNQVTAVTQAAIIAAYAALRTAVNATSGTKLVVLSYAHNKFWRDTAIATDIQSVSADINLDSQRRRLAGRGT